MRPACPCADPFTLAYDPNHDLCSRNFGYLYSAPVPLELLVTSQDWAKSFIMGWPSTHGSAGFTFPSFRHDKPKEDSIGECSYPAENDRITLTEELVCISSEVLEKGEEGKESRSLESLRFRHVQELLIVRTKTESYRPGVDVVVVENDHGEKRQIHWVPGRPAPAAGERYSLRYLTRPEFIIRSVEPRYRRSKAGEIGAPLPPFVRAARVDQVRQ